MTEWEFGLNIKEYETKPPERLCNMFNKNLPSLALGVMIGVIATEFVLKKTPVGKILGLA